jgi:hypothetical protein
VWKDGLENHTWTLRVGYLRYILNSTFYSTCYIRLFVKKKKKASREVEIELSSGEEDEPIDVKPKLEEMEPCCSSSLRD